ncbi:MAG: fasciclin domain-containing protein [Sphingopyxis sp.]|nr:fasciclin domain-containing protein [Sphingopyxis sp.]
MRKALTLRALPLAFGTALIAASGASAHYQAVPAAAAKPRPAANIVDIAVANAAFSTLVTAVKAADLVAPLSAPGPITVFAPTNDAFAKLPAGTVDTLVKPENKAALTGVLTYHVVAGEVTSAKLAEQIAAGGGSAKLKTLAGGTLTASMEGDAVVLTDAKGGKSRVVVADVLAANGVIHAIDTVVMPS